MNQACHIERSRDVYRLDSFLVSPGFSAVEIVKFTGNLYGAIPFLLTGGRCA